MRISLINSPSFGSQIKVVYNFKEKIGYDGPDSFNFGTYCKAKIKDMIPAAIVNRAGPEAWKKTEKNLTSRGYKGYSRGRVVHQLSKDITNFGDKTFTSYFKTSVRRNGETLTLHNGDTGLKAFDYALAKVLHTTMNRKAKQDPTTGLASVNVWIDDKLYTPGSSDIDRVISYPIHSYAQDGSGYSKDAPSPQDSSSRSGGGGEFPLIGSIIGLVLAGVMNQGAVNQNWLPYAIGFFGGGVVGAVISPDEER